MYVFNRKNISLTEKEFKAIEKIIYLSITKEGLPVKELLLRLNGIKKDKAWKVIEFLQSEKKIVIDERGIIKIR
jgi:ATP-dependent DNA helicase RecQ